MKVADSLRRRAERRVQRHEGSVLQHVVTDQERAEELLFEIAKTAPRLTTGRWSITKLFEPHLLSDDGDS